MFAGRTDGYDINLGEGFAHVENRLLGFRDQVSCTLPIPPLDSGLLLSDDLLTGEYDDRMHEMRFDVEFIAAAGGAKTLPCESFWLERLRQCDFRVIRNAEKRVAGLGEEQDGPYFAKLEGALNFDINLGPTYHGYNQSPCLSLTLLLRERIGPDGFKAAYVHSAELAFLLVDEGGGDEVMSLHERRQFYNEIPFTSAHTWTLAERKPHFYEGSWQMH